MCIYVYIYTLHSKYIYFNMRSNGFGAVLRKSRERERESSPRLRQRDNVSRSPWPSHRVHMSDGALLRCFHTEVWTNPRAFHLFTAFRSIDFSFVALLIGHCLECTLSPLRCFSVNRLILNKTNSIFKEGQRRKSKRANDGIRVLYTVACLSFPDARERAPFIFRAVVIVVVEDCRFRAIIVPSSTRKEALPLVAAIPMKIPISGIRKIEFEWHGCTQRGKWRKNKQKAVKWQRC